MIFLLLSELLFFKKTEKEAACPPKIYPCGQHENTFKNVFTTQPLLSKLLDHT
jgi:hypothetical protein